MRVIVAALALAVAFPAMAANVVTGLLAAGAGQALQCDALNAGTKAVAVTVVVSLVGGPSADNSCPALEPGDSCRTGTTAAGTTLAYCTVPNASPKKVRLTGHNLATGERSDGQ
jgi:hypothetical protein